VAHAEALRVRLEVLIPRPSSGRVEIAMPLSVTIVISGMPHAAAFIAPGMSPSAVVPSPTIVSATPSGSLDRDPFA
jgi:hypothetical protein